MTDLVKLSEQLREKATWRNDVHSDLHTAAASALESLSAENAALKQLHFEADDKRCHWQNEAERLLQQRNEAFERAAGAARQVAINAERRAADHIPQSAAANAALDKSEGAYAAEAAIRNLSKES